MPEQKAAHGDEPLSADDGISLRALIELYFKREAKPDLFVDSRGGGPLPVGIAAKKMLSEEAAKLYAWCFELLHTELELGKMMWPKRQYPTEVLEIKWLARRAPTAPLESMPNSALQHYEIADLYRNVIKRRERPDEHLYDVRFLLRRQGDGENLQKVARHVVAQEVMIRDFLRPMILASPDRPPKIKDDLFNNAKQIPGIGDLKRHRFDVAYREEAKSHGESCKWLDVRGAPSGPKKP